jgi:hypothetical protein
MPTNISYVTYADSDNPEGYPDEWIANAVQDADPVPSAPWVTVTLAEFQALMETQQTAFAEVQAVVVEATRREMTRQNAWQAAWDYVNARFDVGGLVRFSAWLSDANANPAGKDMIQAITAWADAVMGLYLFLYKPIALAGGEPDLDYAGNIGEAPYTFTQVIVACNTPWITTQPSNQSVAATETAEFTIVTGGYPSRTYQWYRSDDNGSTWNTLAGATSATYEIETVAEDDGAKFKCRCATSVVAYVDSSVVTLTVA